MSGTPLISKIMDTNKYRYCFIDSSYLVRRNAWGCSRGREPGEYNFLDVVKSSIQTINKLSRDYGVSSDKFILVFDSWSKDYQGYYRSWLLKDKVTYKSSRKFESVDELKRMEQDPNVTEQELHDYACRLYENQQRMEALKVMKNLGKIGIPAIWAESFEFDDIAYMAGVLMSNEDKPSVIVTKDSDLKYCTTPKLDYFSLPTGGSDPEITTYDQMWSEVPDSYKPALEEGAKNGFGSGLYYFKAIMDSLGDGHNDLSKTRRPKTNGLKVIGEVLAGDYTNVLDIDLFRRQIETFQVFNFPKAMEAYQTICSIPKIGHYADMDDFKTFCDSIGLTGISDSYYQEFLSHLEPKLFSE